MSNRAKISSLSLVFPPISSQDAYSFKGQPVKNHMKKSDFYMIGGKAALTFRNFKGDGDLICFDLFHGDEFQDSGSIDLGELPPLRGFSGGAHKVGCGKKDIQIYYDHNGEELLIERYTPESLLWSRSCGLEGVIGLDRYKELMVFDLLYVGIAKKGDSYERLIAHGHHAKADILSNETQRASGARVSDEIFLFFFKVDSLVFHVAGPSDEIDTDMNYDPRTIVADAEKAFVSLLQPRYNLVRFTQYPKGKDGLFNSKLNNYAFSIGEALAFNTPHGKIRGYKGVLFGGVSNKADFIYVDEETSRLYISGDDFSPEEF
ncbi:hypothetical protein [Pseudomonas syringae group genomosp. 3]|uniref:hypothetical protein n=1 Tax=Pseudomonas syringae group genomosp. 3 TaxID=251701 RepID=UPI000710B73E|nr:hypothetical protein [Pseudomonas syringae group genomosp. 3]